VRKRYYKAEAAFWRIGRAAGFSEDFLKRADVLLYRRPAGQHAHELMLITGHQPLAVKQYDELGRSMEGYDEQGPLMVWKWLPDLSGGEYDDFGKGF
jgi:hypothetical protein